MTARALPSSHSFPMHADEYVDWHVVRGGKHGPALCGLTPRRECTGWSDEGMDETFASCRRCRTLAEVTP